MASSSPTLARTGDAEGVVSTGRPKDLKAKRSCDEGQVNAMAVSTEPALYGGALCATGTRSSDGHRTRARRGTTGGDRRLSVWLVGGNPELSRWIERDQSIGQFDDSRSVGRVGADCSSGSNKIDNFRKLALQEVQNRNFAAAVEPLRNAGAALVVVPVSPTKGQQWADAQDRDEFHDSSTPLAEW